MLLFFAIFPVAFFLWKKFLKYIQIECIFYLKSLLKIFLFWDANTTQAASTLKLLPTTTQKSKHKQNPIWEWKEPKQWRKKRGHRKKQQSLTEKIPVRELQCEDVWRNWGHGKQKLCAAWSKGAVGKGGWERGQKNHKSSSMKMEKNKYQRRFCQGAAKDSFSHRDGQQWQHSQHGRASPIPPASEHQRLGIGGQVQPVGSSGRAMVTRS